MRRVLLVSYEFPPSAEVGAQSCVQIARHLPRYGWEPVVLTVQERYFRAVNAWSEREFPGLVVRTRVLPHLLSLYKRVRPRPQLSANGGGHAENGHGAKGRLRRWALALLQTPDVYTGWIPPAVVGALKVVHRQKIDHLWSSGPYWTCHLVGLALARLTGLPWAAHFRDPWAQGEQRLVVSALSRRIDAALERRVVAEASVVVCVTDQHAALFREAYGLPPDKVVSIPNGYDEAEWHALAPRAGAERTERDAFVIAYAGSLYLQRDPRPLFRAVRALIDSGDVARDRIRVDFIGDCEMAEGQSVTAMARECGVDSCVRMPGRLGRQETLRRLVQASLLLVLAERWTLQVPAKTYEYLRAGRPILALTSEGALADLVRRTRAGWVADPADGAGVLRAVREAYRGWTDRRQGPRADPEVLAGFDRRILAGCFADVFERATAAIRAR